MTLSKEDIKKIENVVDSRFNLLDLRLDKLESYMRVRFDEIDVRLDKIERKIEQLIKTENEDIQVALRKFKPLNYE